MNNSASLPATVALLLCGGVVAADEGDAPPLTIGYNLTVTSDYVFRGVSQTMSGPALQGGVDLEHRSGVYAYGWVSNVDFVASGDPDDGSRVEADLAIGYAFDLTESLALDLSVVRYVFPSTRDHVDYDYSEWIAAIHLPRDLRFTAGYADDVFGTGDPGVFYQIDAHFELPLKLYLVMQLGHYDLERPYGESYQYGAVTLGRTLGNRADWSVSVHDTSASAEDLFYSSTAKPRVVAALNLTF